MAKPPNPLDKYTTYAYHFELHCSPNTKDLLDLAGVSDEKTEKDRPNGTLLINSRYDAHQTIDNLNFSYAWPGTIGNGSIFVPTGKLTFDVIEPGACYFLEKIQNCYTLNKVDYSSGVQFALKILFVGRKPDNEIDIIDDLDPIILTLIDISAGFSYKGGEYKMIFETMTSSLTSANSSNPIASNLGFINRNLSITAKTTGEAISNLSNQLNKHYTDTFSTEVSATSGRKLVYDVFLDPVFDADFKTVETDAKLEDDPGKLQFTAQTPIQDMILQIIRKAPDINDAIGASLDGINKEFHPGVIIPIVTSSVIYKPDIIEVNYKVVPYKGNDTNKYEFDFYFTGDSKNVDVMDFDMKYPSLVKTWLAIDNDYGAMYGTNKHGYMPIYDGKKNGIDQIAPDVSKKEGKVEYYNIKKCDLELNKNDIACLPSSSINDDNAYNNTYPENVSSEKKATLAHVLYGSSPGREAQFIMNIRGHASMMYKQISKDGFTYGTTDGLWIKLNIYDSEGRPFYYRGYYRCLSIVNHFRGGSFTQEVALQELVRGQEKVIR